MRAAELRLYCFIDALGWKLAEQHRFLEDILVTRARLGTLLGYSSTCDPSILTGKLPREHGHFSFFYYDRKGSPLRWLRHLRWLPRQITSRGRVRHWISRLVGRAHGYTGYFQLYNVPFEALAYLNYSEKRDIYQPGGILGGQKTFLDRWRSSIPYALSDWRLSEERNLQNLTHDLGRPSRAYLYLAAMDAILHRDGTQAATVATKLAWYEKQLRQLLDCAARHYQEVKLYIFSDHGMTDVVRCLDLRTPLERMPLVYGQDYVAVIDSTLARFWFLKSDAESRVREWLSGVEGGHLMSEQELRHYGCDFANHFYGELWYLADPGVLFCPGHLGEKPLAGMHGYAPEHPDSPGFFGASEELAATPPGLCDLYPLFCEDLP